MEASRKVESPGGDFEHLFGALIHHSSSLATYQAINAASACLSKREKGSSRGCALRAGTFTQTCSSRAVRLSFFSPSPCPVIVHNQPLRNGVEAVTGTKARSSSADNTGLSVHSTAELAPDTRLISCPFDLAITTSTARTALAELYPNVDDKAYTGWNERMLVAVYVILHCIHTSPRGDTTGDASSSSQTQPPKSLRHRAYVDVLPSRGGLRTPAYFSPAERGLLRGTNLDLVVRDREAELRDEYGRVKEVVREAEWYVGSGSMVLVAVCGDLMPSVTPTHSLFFFSIPSGGRLYNDGSHTPRTRDRASARGHDWVMMLTPGNNTSLPRRTSRPAPSHPGC